MPQPSKKRKVNFALAPEQEEDKSVEDFCEPNDSERDDSDAESDELLYTKTKKECSPFDDDQETDDQDDESEDFDALETEFDCFDPSEKFYHGIRHFFVESVLPGLGIREKGTKLCGKSDKSRDPDAEKLESQDSDNTDNDEKDVEKETQTHITSKAPLASRLSDCVCEQGNIGTILCIPAEDDNNSASDAPVGFATILNFQQYFDQGLKEIKLALLNAARRRLEPRAFRVFKNIIDPSPDQSRPLSRNKQRLYKKRGIPLPPSAGGVCPVAGLFLCERLVNLPHQVAPTLLSNLAKDVEWSQTTPTCPEDERPHYFFTHLIGVSHCFALNPDDSHHEKSAPATTGQKLHDVKGQQRRLAFRKFEDEVFLKHADIHFTIPTTFTSRVAVETSEKRRSSMIDTPEHRLVFVIPYSKLKCVIQECEAIIEAHEG